MRNKGFTLIELLIVVAIVIIISCLSLFVGLDFYKSHALSSEREVVVNILMKARNNALNNVNQSPHGVYIDSNGYTIFQGSSYAMRDMNYDEFIDINAVITSSGLQEIVFEQLSGDLTTPEGSINLTSNERSVTISLNNEGRINW